MVTKLVTALKVSPSDWLTNPSSVNKPWQIWYRYNGLLVKVQGMNGEDRWARAAVLSGIGKRIPEFLEAFRKQQSADPLAFSAVMHDVGQLVGNGNSLKDCELLLRDVISSDKDDGWRIATALGLVEGISGRAGIKPSRKGPLFALLGENASKFDRYALDTFITL